MADIPDADRDDQAIDPPVDIVAKCKPDIYRGEAVALCPAAHLPGRVPQIACPGDFSHLLVEASDGRPTPRW